MSQQPTLLHRLLFNPIYAAGLDIQDHTLTLAHVKPGDDTLDKLHLHPLPEGIVENGEIINERAFAKHLLEALTDSGIKSGHWVTHPPIQHTALRHLSLPPMPKKDVKSAVRYEASRNLPFPLTDASIDFDDISADEPKRKKERKTRPQPRRTKRRSLLARRAKPDPAAALEQATPGPEAAPDQTPPRSVNEEHTTHGRKGLPRSMLVAATPLAQVLKLMRVAKAAGVKLAVVEPRQVATLRALKHHDRINADELVLSVTETHANLTVIAGNAVRLARNLPYGKSDLESGKPSAVDGFQRDLIATIEYATRFSDHLNLTRLAITGAELHRDALDAVEGLNLAAYPVRVIDGVPTDALSAYGMALRGARGI